MTRAAFVLCALAATARAEPAVDIADLPPLPAAEDVPTSSATLLAAANTEEDVVVGAAKREQSLGNVASAVTVISADRIRRFGYRTVAEAIASVAGVYIQDTRLTQQVGIRGLQIPGGFNSRLLVLVDGATVNEAWGAFAGVGYDGLVSIDDVARIEVIRGPVSSVYGTNAFFGIINIVTRAAAEGSRAWGKLAINSINGEVATAGFAAGGVDRQLRGSVLAMNRIGESLQVGEIAGMPLEADGANTVIASVVGSSGGTFGQLRAYRSRRDSPFAPYDSDPALDPAFSLYNYQLILEGGHTRELSKRTTVGVRVYGNLYRYYDEIRTVGDLFLDYGDARTAGVEVRGRHEALDDGRLGITAGAEVSYNQTESRSFFEGMEADGAKVPVDFNTEGVYTELDSRITSWFAVTAGARFDRHSVVDQGTRLSPRAALFLSSGNDFGFKLLYAEGFRYPSMFEGFFEDRVDFIKNTAIVPEIIRSGEAIAWFKRGGLAFRASAFVWDARDVIEQRPADNPFTPPPDLDVLQFQNISHYLTRGAEAELSYRNSAGWYGFGGVCINAVGTDVVDEMTGQTALETGSVFDAPVTTAAAGVSSPKLFDLGHVSLEAQFLSQRVVRQPDPASGQPPSPKAPAWLGLNAAIFIPGLRGFDVTIGARNLLGKRDLVPAPDDYDRFSVDPGVVVSRIPAEGREVYAKVGYSY